MSSRPALPKQLSSIGEWKLGQPFGHGNHAIIRQGRSKTDGSEVVIKELAKTSPRTDGLLRQEAVIMGASSLHVCIAVGAACSSVCSFRGAAALVFLLEAVLFLHILSSNAICWCSMAGSVR